MEAWREFLRGKRKRKDVAEFSLNLADNIILLHRELSNQTYCHGSYQSFRINDPKPRQIHKASVRDRLVHHAVYRVLYSYFDCKFIFDSYSCRQKKGTHRAINRFREFGRKVYRNHTKTVWVLKCDIKKFFASIDQVILLDILRKYISDEKVMWLLGQIIDSYFEKGKNLVGLPLGNLTSQLLVNIYMNEFDQFVKRELRAKYYIRYADDFVVLSKDRKYLENLLPTIERILEERLKLSLHPEKLFIKTLASGIDFLGWVHFPHHRVLRTTTKRRMMKKLRSKEPEAGMLESYLGLLLHGNTWKLMKKLDCMLRANE